MSVGAAEFIGRPFLDGVHQINIHAEHETFCLLRFPHALLIVQRTCIDNGLRGLFATEYNQQIADHGGAFVVVKVDDAISF